MPPLVSITWSTELKELQQWIGKAHEQQWKHSDQLDEFQEIGAQLSVKAVSSLQAVQDDKKEFNAKMVEYPLKQDCFMCQDVAEKFKAQVAEIS